MFPTPDPSVPAVATWVVGSPDVLDLVRLGVFALVVGVGVLIFAVSTVSAVAMRR